MSQDDVTPTPQQEGSAPPAGRRGFESIRSMVISMVLVALAVLAWWAFVPRSDKQTQPVADVGGIAREVGIAKHWDPAVAQGLGKGWQAVNVRLVKLDKQPDTWQAGYDAPGGSYARVLQTRNGDRAWVRAQTSAATGDGEDLTIGGVRWSKRVRDSGGERSLVRSRPMAGLATVVTGTGDWEQLVRFARSLRPLSTSGLASTGGTAPSGR